MRYYLNQRRHYLRSRHRKRENLNSCCFQNKLCIRPRILILIKCPLTICVIDSTSL
uniref:Uncharacterized protein n=1 Tax=Arundo donax TaxID=35708 RepID=A0A0A9E6C6_ARUDO